MTRRSTRGRHAWTRATAARIFSTISGTPISAKSGSASPSCITNPALRIDPSNDDYRHNLKFAQAFTKTRSGRRQKNRFSRRSSARIISFRSKHSSGDRRTRVAHRHSARAPRPEQRTRRTRTRSITWCSRRRRILGIIAMSAGHKAYVLVTEKKKGVVTAANTM